VWIQHGQENGSLTLCVRIIRELNAHRGIVFGRPRSECGNLSASKLFAHLSTIITRVTICRSGSCIVGYEFVTVMVVIN
jgi:hypothetical protein